MVNQHSPKRHPLVISCALIIGVLAMSGCKKEEPLPQPGASTVSVTPGDPATPALPSGMNSGVLTPFSGAIDASGGHCELDSLNGSGNPTSKAAVGQKLSGGGWMIDAGAQVPASATLVLASPSAKFGMQLLPGGARPDVAATLQNPAFETAGFNFEADTTSVAAGSYKIFVVYVDGKSCALNKEIILE